MNTIIRSVGMVFAIIVAAAAASTVLEIGIINVSHAQVTPSQLTPEQKSKICGIPSAATVPTTTGPSKPISPSSPGSITPQEPILLLL